MLKDMFRYRKAHLLAMKKGDIPRDKAHGLASHRDSNIGIVNIFLIVNRKPFLPDHSKFQSLITNHQLLLTDS